MGVRLKTDPNRPPTIDNPIDGSFEVGTAREISFASLASDPDGDATTVFLNEAAVPLPAGFSFADDILSWSGFGSAGVSSGHTATASDGELISSDSEAFSLTVTEIPVAEDSQDFGPKTALFRIGRQDWGSEPEVSLIATLDFVVINGHQREGASKVTNVTDFLSAVYAINPKLDVYDYTDLTESGEGGTHGAKLDSFVHSVTGDGWVYNADGDKVSTFSSGSGPSFHANLTTWLNVDGFGDRFSEYYAKDVNTTQLVVHNTGAPSSYRLKPYNDVNDHRVRSNGQDFDRNGSNDRGRSDWNKPGTRGFTAAGEIREGHKRFWDTLYSLNPGMPGIANITTHNAETMIIDPNDPDYPPLPHSSFENLFHGGIEEGLSQEQGRFPFGGFNSDGLVKRVLDANGDELPGNAVHGFGSFRRWINLMLYGMRECIGKKQVAGGWQINIANESRNPIVGTDMTAKEMQLARHAICGEGLTDGYVSIHPLPGRRNRTVLFDYYGTTNEATTGLERHYYGPAIDMAMEIAEELSGVSNVWIGTDQAGIHKRERANVLILLNSTKSDTGFIDIPILPGGSLAGGHLPDGDWWEVNGRQDTAIDRGIRVSTSTQLPDDSFPFASGNYRLNNSDGRILIRHGYSGLYT